MRGCEQGRREAISCRECVLVWVLSVNVRRRERTEDGRKEMRRVTEKEGGRGLRGREGEMGNKRVREREGSRTILEKKDKR